MFILMHICFHIRTFMYKKFNFFKNERKLKTGSEGQNTRHGDLLWFNENYKKYFTFYTFLNFYY